MADKFSFKLDGVAAGRDPAILAAPLTRLEAAVVQSWCSCGALLQRPSNQPAHHAKISASGSMLRAGEDAHVTASLPTTLDVQLSNLGMKACRTRMQDARRRTQDAGCRMQEASCSSLLAPRPLPPPSAPKRECEDLWPERLAHSAPPARAIVGHAMPSRPIEALSSAIPFLPILAPSPLRGSGARAQSPSQSPPTQPCRLPTRAARAPYKKGSSYFQTAGIHSRHLLLPLAALGKQCDAHGRLADPDT
jgi:hypothetical protein